MRTGFEAAYFRRYYKDSDSRVYGAREIDHLARGVTGFIKWLGGEIRSVLDVGAGTGLWRAWFRRNLPAAKYRSVDISAYACKTYGHERRDITTWRAREEFQLIVCQGVLPYLSDRACVRAVANMAAMCGGFLYLEAITARDLRDVCDRDRTDTAVRARTGAFYRRALAPHFQPLGLGLYHARRIDRPFFELERGR
jgi:trans-aconitate methyltransferase